MLCSSVEKEKTKILASNRKANFEYHILNSYEAGIILTGTEIKSVRDSQVNMNDAYCHFLNGELFIRNLHIAEYKQGTHYNHEPKRERKLLLNKSELNKLQGKSKERGLTIVPLKIYINERGYAKIEIALVKGKKLFDKRSDIKEREGKREIERNLKRF